MTKSLEELRKPKLQAWNCNKENSRAWLALNMMNEARTGFRAFNEGNKEIGREIDFVKLRQGLAKGVPWTEELIESLMPGAKEG
jgi:6-oxo-cyclohex-1-ene-carbonyl-CoA hydrolase